jgi:quercetin dioxygenase-like cupin family protein
MGMSDRSKNFYVNFAKDAKWVQNSQPNAEKGTHGFRVFNEYRDLGLAQATGGRYFGHVVHPKITRAERAGLPHGGATGIHNHEVDFQVVYVLKGWLKFAIEDNGEVVLNAGDFIYIPPSCYHGVLDYSDDLETFEILSPAEYKTNPVDVMPGTEKAPA